MSQLHAADEQDIHTFLHTQKVATAEKRDQLMHLIQAVAHIPWGEGRTIEEVLKTKGVGTCTGKHVVLQACFDVLKIPYRIVVCTFRWSEQGLRLPDYLQAILEEGEWIHGHNFLQIQNDDGKWIDIDVTWDPLLKPHGFRTFPANWDGNTPFVGLHSLIERWDDAPLIKKQEWQRALTPEMQERRERFLHKFFAWVESLRI